MPVDPQLSRRALLAAGTVTLTALAGCTSDGAPMPGADPTDAGDPDQQLVDDVLVKLSAAWQGAVAASAFDLVALHRVQLEALGGTPPTPSAARVSLRSVRRNERRLHTDLVGASMAAKSGELARLLASMSAAVSQQLVVL